MYFKGISKAVGSVLFATLANTDEWVAIEIFGREHNLNIIRKLALNMLKIYETGKKGMSIGMKRFSIGTNPEKHLENILTL